MVLHNGDSVATVKREVGTPAAEFGEPAGRVTLSYPRWRIYFSNDRMFRRIQEVRRLHAETTPNGDPPSAQVLSLRRGMSVSQVMHHLGRPDVVEVEYEADRSPERIMRYGAWEIRFRNGVLRVRTHQ